MSTQLSPGQKYTVNIVVEVEVVDVQEFRTATAQFRESKDGEISMVDPGHPMQEIGNAVRLRLSAPDIVAIPGTLSQLLVQSTEHFVSSEDL